MENREDIATSSTNGDSDIRHLRKRNAEAGHGIEIDDIISVKPPLVVRWGTMLFFVLLLVVAGIAWITKYPDIVVADGMLNSINAPKEVIAKSEGKLVQLFTAENKKVEQGEVLGYIECTANHREVLALSGFLDSASLYIWRNETDRLPKHLFLRFNNLGELQGDFQLYMQSLREFTDYLSNGFYLRKKTMLNEDLGFLRRMHDAMLRQKDILSQDLTLADSTFKASEILKSENVISANDYRSEKSKLLSKQMTLPQIASSIISNENLQHEKQKEIAELENRIQQQKGIFVQALNTFRSSVEEWKKNYLLIAPVDGSVSFATFIQENQFLKPGQLVCFVNPGNANYYIEARIPQYNFGKVKTGQFVLLKFAAYPYEEFGKVSGKILAINSIPTDSGYLAKIGMPMGLTTNYKKQIQYRTGLTVQADIITENRRLLQRVFENMTKRINR